MAVRKRGKKFYIDFYDKEGKRHVNTAGESRKDAEILLGKKRAEVRENKYFDVKKENAVTFEEFADRYYNSHCLANNKNLKFAEYNIKVLKQHFGKKLVREITLSMINDFKVKKAEEIKLRQPKDKKEEDISYATVNRNLAFLRAILYYAKADGLIQNHPMHRKIKFYKEKMRVRFLEVSELEKLVSNCPENLKPLVVTAVNTGMRKGELLGLKWQDVDFQHDIIYLHKTKNGEKREVSMNAIVKATLIATPKRENDSLIFDKTNLRKDFLKAVESSGIINFHFHDIRHTAASHMVMSGVDLNTVREVLGHKSMAMTLRYAHLSPSYKMRAVARLENVFSGLTPAFSNKMVTNDNISAMTKSDKTLNNIENINENPIGPVAQLVRAVDS